MENLFSAFGIDYKILLAQLFNFFLIFFIIYKFLLRPLSKVIEERQNKISEGLRLREESKKLIKKIRKIKESILNKAYKERENILLEAETIKKQNLDNLMKEIAALREKMLLNLDKEKFMLEEKFYSDLNEKFPKIFSKMSKRIFHNKELNEEFIKNMLSNNGSKNSWTNNN
jgi:F-type H+-transporting ATPase subunit b